MRSSTDVTTSRPMVVALNVLNEIGLRIAPATNRIENSEMNASFIHLPPLLLVSLEGNEAYDEGEVYDPEREVDVVRCLPQKEEDDEGTGENTEEETDHEDPPKMSSERRLSIWSLDD